MPDDILLIILALGSTLTVWLWRAARSSSRARCEERVRRALSLPSIASQRRLAAECRSFRASLQKFIGQFDLGDDDRKRLEEDADRWVARLLGTSWRMRSRP